MSERLWDVPSSCHCFGLDASRVRQLSTLRKSSPMLGLCKADAFTRALAVVYVCVCVGVHMRSHVCWGKL